MSAVVGIATLVLLGVSIIAALSWSCRHRHIAVSGIGRGVAVVTAMSSGFIAFALIADNVGVRPRLAGTLATAVFATVAIASILIACRPSTSPAHRRVAG